MHTLNTVHGVHVVLLYLCCGALRIPWSLLIWRGKGQPSPTQLAFRLLRGLPLEVRHSSKTTHLLADGGFSSKAFIQGVIALGSAGFIGMRADQKTSTGQGVRNLATPGRKIELLDLPGVRLWLSWVWLSAKKGDHQEQRFIVSTAPRTAQVIKRTGNRRWKIEALFNALKSRFGCGTFGQYSKRAGVLKGRGGVPRRVRSRRQSGLPKKKGVLRFLCLSLLSVLLCRFEFLDRLDPGDSSWPDWPALACRLRQMVLAGVRLVELHLEIDQVNAVQNALLRLEL